jgi:cytochrome c oxidase subunit 1
VIFLYFFSSIFLEEICSKSWWNSNTLEWTVEHIHSNWQGEIPHGLMITVIHHEEDFVSQNVPMKESEKVLHH